MRRTGRTIRLIDKYIQDLFENGFVEIIDHNNNTNENRVLFGKIMTRLEIEHLNQRNNFIFDNKNFTIKWLMYQNKKHQ